MTQSGEHRIGGIVFFAGRPPHFPGRPPGPLERGGDHPDSRRGCARDSQEEPARSTQAPSSCSLPVREAGPTCGDHNTVRDRAVSNARQSALLCEGDPSEIQRQLFLARTCPSLQQPSAMTPAPPDPPRSRPHSVPPSELSTCQACLTIVVLALLVAALCLATLRLLRSVDREVAPPLSSRADAPSGGSLHFPPDGKGAPLHRG
ncbi:uncharacterized protein [Dermacentor albipictus]|uniref:uncharacterized protein n=1 Tax=Dermacentor albipictus TaxID=60249 RepID=UPI0031FCC3DA